jgi:hypothetical protein
MWHASGSRRTSHAQTCTVMQRGEGELWACLWQQEDLHHIIIQQLWLVYIKLQQLRRGLVQLLVNQIRQPVALLQIHMPRCSELALSPATVSLPEDAKEIEPHQHGTHAQGSCHAYRKDVPSGITRDAMALPHDRLCDICNQLSPDMICKTLEIALPGPKGMFTVCSSPPAMLRTLCAQRTQRAS